MSYLAGIILFQKRIIKFNIVSEKTEINVKERIFTYRYNSRDKMINFIKGNNRYFNSKRSIRVKSNIMQGQFTYIILSKL
jgi:hypothetical protein